MRIYLAILGLILVIGCTKSNINDRRIKRIVIMDTGININAKLRSFLCKDGHRSYLPNTNWDSDEYGHGTQVAELVAKNMIIGRHCMMIYKTSDGKSQPEAYATALKELTMRGDFDVLLAAIEDVSYYYAEVGFYSKITSFADVVVPSGNDKKMLTEKSCEIYPACLYWQMVKKDKFHVIGAQGFNKGTLLRTKRNPYYKSLKGTSFSAARWAGELLSQK